MIRLRLVGYPPSIALALVGAIVLMFGGKPEGRKMSVKKDGMTEL